MVFGIQRALPGDPAVILAGEQQDPEVIAFIRAKYRLDEPVPIQYLAWLGQLARGDLGSSMRTGEPVSSLIFSKLPVTVELALLSILVAVNLGWLPASGYVSLFDDPVENLRRMVMPAFVLGTGLAAVLMRQMRSAMLEVLSQDYVRTAKAKGTSAITVLIRHAMRNALIPVVTILGLQLGTLLSGAVLTEQVFTIPGFGKLVVDAVFNRDYAVVQGVVLFTATAYIAINLVVDVLYAVLDPRISGSRA